jgi:hypothetical protein
VVFYVGGMDNASDVDSSAPEMSSQPPSQDGAARYGRHELDRGGHGSAALPQTQQRATR